MTWIQTYTGKSVDLLDPSPGTICIEDIAHALSRICRYKGHTEKHYSVAEHCIHVSQQVNEDFALEGLLHDATEAYLQDLSRPLKVALRTETGRGADLQYLRSAYDILEDRMQAVIAARFGVPACMSDAVKTQTCACLLPRHANWVFLKRPHAHGIYRTRHTLMVCAVTRQRSRADFS